MDQMRQEKMQLNQKLDDFSNILREFQENQRMQADENHELRQKIQSMESFQYGNKATDCLQSFGQSVSTISKNANRPTEPEITNEDHNVGSMFTS